MVKQLLLIFRRYWRRLPWQSASSLSTVFVTVPSQNKLQDKQRAKDVSESGRFYFREKILDQLDEYFVFIRRMRSHDPNAYAIYSKIGAAIASEKTLMWMDELPASWRVIGDRPSFAAIAVMGVPDLPTKVHARFIYFRKHKVPPPWVQKVSDGDVYEVTLFYSIKDKPVVTAPAKFHVHVSPTCKVELLRWKINHGEWKYDKKRHCDYRIPQKGWEFPETLEDLVRDNPGDGDIHQLAREVFTFTATTQESIASDIRISASKDGVTAVFGIDLLRTPYFFKDREVTVNVRGSKKRIFHVVRPHERHMSDGRVLKIKNHFRGERKFVWNGYNVLITLPGKHHPDLLRFDAGSIDDKKSAYRSERMLTPIQLGQELKHLVEK